MATLANRSSDGRLSFVKYVIENSFLEQTEFTIEIGAKTSLYVDDGHGFTPSNHQLIHGVKFSITCRHLYDEQKLRLAKVKLSTGEVGYIPIKYIRKPTNASPTKYEKIVVRAINEFIFKQPNRCIDLLINDRVHSIVSALQVDARIKAQSNCVADPKADIILCTTEAGNDPISPRNVFLSHKRGGGATGFQQYGGLSITAGERVYWHPQIQEFMRCVIARMDNGKGLSSPVMQFIHYRELVDWSVFGIHCDREEHGLYHVHGLAQGIPDITPLTSGVYHLSFEHYVASGESHKLIGGYMPVLGATYRAGRGFVYQNVRYHGARLGVYPFAFMANRTNLVEL